MPIIQANGHTTGTVGIVPNLIYINTNDTPATVTTAGYLTAAVHEGLISPQNTDLALVGTVTAGVHSTLLLQVTITGVSPNLVYSLTTPVNSGGAIFAGNVQAGSNGVAGRFISYPATINTGHSEWFATSNGGAFNALYTNAALAQTTTFTTPDPGVAAASYLLTQNAGTQTIATGSLALSVGTLTLGSSGHASSLTLFPATAANGTLIISPLNAGGAFNTTLRNSVMGQSSVISIPDPGAATANVVLAPAALVNNNLIKASGTAGRAVDAGFFVTANTTAVYGGGGTSNAFVAAGLTATSIVTATILTSTNAVAIAKAVPTANTLTVTFTADPGAATTVSYIATSVAV